MRLSELLSYDQIVVQCHDNPDADALASGFGVYTYFKTHEKNVRFIYGNRYPIQKSNLVLMKVMLQIPVEHVETLEPPELLITVDCQCGAIWAPAPRSCASFWKRRVSSSMQINGWQQPCIMD